MLVPNLPLHSSTFRVKALRAKATVTKKLLPLRNRAESQMVRLTREAVLEYSQMKTGEKYLVTP